MNHSHVKILALAFLAFCGFAGSLSAGGGREQGDEAGPGTAKLYNTKDFDQVEIAGNFSFTIRQGSEFLVKIETSEANLKKMSVEQFGSKLVIKRQASFMDRASLERAHVEIVMPSIKALSAGGACNGTLLMDDRNVETSTFSVEGASELELNCIGKKVLVTTTGASRLSGRLVAEEAELKFFGASKGKLKLEASSLLTEINGASGLSLIGKSNVTKAKIFGASELNAKEFTCLAADIDATGASHALIIVNETAKFRASGASSIEYAGSASPSLSEASGASAIHKRDSF